MNNKLEQEIWLENFTEHCITNADTDGLFEGNTDLCNSCIYDTGICPDCGLFAHWVDINNRMMVISCEMYEKSVDKH